MIFWSTRLVLALMVVPLLVIDWRVALVVAYALVAELVILV